MFTYSANGNYTKKLLKENYTSDQGQDSEAPTIINIHSDTAFDSERDKDSEDFSNKLIQSCGVSKDEALGAYYIFMDDVHTTIDGGLSRNELISGIQPETNPYNENTLDFISNNETRHCVINFLTEMNKKRNQILDEENKRQEELESFTYEIKNNKLVLNWSFYDIFFNHTKELIKKSCDDKLTESEIDKIAEFQQKLRESTDNQVVDIANEPAFKDLDPSINKNCILGKMNFVEKKIDVFQYVLEKCMNYNNINDNITKTILYDFLSSIRSYLLFKMTENSVPPEINKSKLIELGVLYQHLFDTKIQEYTKEVLCWEKGYDSCLNQENEEKCIAEGYESCLKKKESTTVNIVTNTENNTVDNTITASNVINEEEAEVTAESGSGLNNNILYIFIFLVVLYFLYKKNNF
tara:strand:- start:866 stop:2092 length:1227 start_codon:yes stop_codon:yes gene_type:complete